MHEIKDFIGIFHNVVNEDYCKEVIRFFNEVDGLGGVYNRQKNSTTPSTKKDNDIFHTDDPCAPQVFNAMFYLMRPFVDAVDVAYKTYREKYGILEELSPHRISSQIQMQRVRPGQGYHIWHCESGEFALCTRLLVPILYLNDVTEGGETEFLYQSMRIAPKMGTLVLFPASFTHTHRGNPPLSGEKYFITSWLQFVG
jgi:hypothetical protein